MTEQRDQKNNYVILRDRQQRDKKISDKEGIEMTATQSAMNIDNQNEMIVHSKIIFKKKFCYGFLAGIFKDHKAKKCSTRRPCQVCNGRHATTVHGVKWTKRTRPPLKMRRIMKSRMKR